MMTNYDSFSGRVLAKVLSSPVPRDIEPNVWQYNPITKEVAPAPGKQELAVYARQEIETLFKKNS